MRKQPLAAEQADAAYLSEHVIYLVAGRPRRQLPQNAVIAIAAERDPAGYRSVLSMDDNVLGIPETQVPAFAGAKTETLMVSDVDGTVTLYTSHDATFTSTTRGINNGNK